MASKYHDGDDSQQKFFNEINENNDKLIDYYDTSSYLKNRIEENNDNIIEEHYPLLSLYHREYNQQQQQQPEDRKFRDIFENKFVNKKTDREQQLQESQQEGQNQVPKVNNNIDEELEKQQQKQYSIYQNQQSLPLFPSSSVSSSSSFQLISLQPSPVRLTSQSKYQQLSPYIVSPLTSPLLLSPPSSPSVQQQQQQQQQQQFEKFTNEIRLLNENNKLLRQRTDSSNNINSGISNKNNNNNKNIFNYFITSRKLRNIHENQKQNRILLNTNELNNNNNRNRNNDHNDDGNTIWSRTSTSIKVSKNLTSTNFVKQQQQQQQQDHQKEVKRNPIEVDNLYSQQQELQYQIPQNVIRNHQQTRSIIDSSEISSAAFHQSRNDLINFQQQLQQANNNLRSSDAVAHDRADISNWLESTTTTTSAIPFNTILGAALIGLFILGLIITFWLKILKLKRRCGNNNNNTNGDRANTKNGSECLIETNDIKTKLFNKFANLLNFNNKLINKSKIHNNKIICDERNDIVDKFKVMEHECTEIENNGRFECEKTNDDDNNDCNNENSNFNDSLPKSPTITERNQRIYVDEKLSPIIIDDKNFIFSSPTPLTTTVTTNDGNITSTSNNKIPIPVPVPIPTPQQVFPQFVNNNLRKSTLEYDLKTTRILKNEKHSSIDVKTKHQPHTLVKSFSLTSSTSSSSPSSTPPVTTSGRRFSLYERRTQQLHHQHLTVPTSPLPPLLTSEFQQQQQQKQHSSSISISIGETHSTPTKSHSKCNSPKTQLDTNCNHSTDDKENEVPAGDEAIYSPKMKLSEHVLAQQNSPRHFDTPPSSASSITTTISRFSFSSKQNLHSDTSTSSPSIISTPISTSVGLNLSHHNVIANHSNDVNSSPLLSSAVCKHGDYFRFPDVDCLTPVEKKIATSSYVHTVHTNSSASSPLTITRSSYEPKSTASSKMLSTISTPTVLGKSESISNDQHLSENRRDKLTVTMANTLNTINNTVQSPSTINQATRRSRLKSISLDSDGARLVEDNLGIAVEELIEIANQSPKIDDECFVFDDAISKMNTFSLDNDKSTATNEVMINNERKKMTTPNLINDNNHHRYNPLNKNRLTISIPPSNESQLNKNCDETDGSCNDDIADNDNTNLNNNSNLRTPKTPTLTQTKQKAISLDSSDTIIMHYMPASHNLCDSSSTATSGGGGGEQTRKLSNSATTSLLQISSISVPTTPKRQQLQMLCSGRNKLISSKKGSSSGSGKYTTSSTPPTIANIGKPTASQSSLLPSVALPIPGKLHSSSLTGHPTMQNLQLSSSFDYHSMQKQNSTTSNSHFMRKLRSFNENTIDDDDYDDHYFLDVVDGVVVVEEDTGNSAAGLSTYIDDVDASSSLNSLHHQFIGSNSSSNTNLLGANLLNQRCSTSLSLSNNNLKTLPEVMTLNDFTNDEDNLPSSSLSHHHKLHIDDDTKMKTSSSSTPTIIGQFSSSLTQITTQSPTSSLITSNNIGNNTGGGGSGGLEGAPGIRTPRNSILQRRGSNHSLTLNLNGGSLGNLSKSLSVSNYSLGSANFQNSQLNLSGSSYNLNNNKQLHHQSTMLNTVAGTTSLGGSRMPDKHPSVSSITNFTGSSGSNKKNLLQRRGSNTSLTLNIKGSSCMNLNRFNSHSSLNISSQQHQNYVHHQNGIINQTIHSGSGGGNILPSNTNQGRKGLLERRNSNASLTLNIQNRALSVSNCNLRGSACSLNSNPVEYFEHHIITESNCDPDHRNCYHEHGAQYDPTIMDASASSQQSHHQRKFLSSENLNIISQRSKLNQTHFRNSSKTCFGSVSDLNPQQIHHQQITMIGQQQQQQNQQQLYHHQQQQLIEGNISNHHLQNMNIDELFNFEGILPNTSSGGGIDNNKLPFKQSNLCSCTGVRNITTRPLSPQSTSEDFKMYLANIQLLQNASNMLNSEHLRKLNYIFEKSYSGTTISSTINTKPTNKIDDDHRKQKFFANDTTTDDTSSHVPAVSTSNVAENTVKNDDMADDDTTVDNTDSCKKINKTDDSKFNDDIVNITINFELPNDDEQKSLLRNLHQEFWDLPTNFQEKPLVFGSQTKNRYKSILPNEHSRVILDCEPGYIQEPYINANYIKGPDYAQNSYIATQGPMPNTIYEYWLMIYQNIKKFVSKNDNQEKNKLTKVKTIAKSLVGKTETMKRRFDFEKIDDVIASESDEDNDDMGMGDNNTTNITMDTNQYQNNMNFNQKIAMLTNFIEHNKQKCSVYFPIDENELILITNTNEKIDNGELIEFYKLYLSNKNDMRNNILSKIDLFFNASSSFTLKNDSNDENDDNSARISNNSDNNDDKSKDNQNDEYYTGINDKMERDSSNRKFKNKSSTSSIKQRKIVFTDQHLIDLIPKMNYFIIKNDGVINKNGYTIRKLLCFYCQQQQQQQQQKQENNEQFINTNADENNVKERNDIIYKQLVEQFECYHYWYPDWPDHRSPSDIGVLLDMSLHLLDGQCEKEFQNYENIKSSIAPKEEEKDKQEKVKEEEEEKINDNISPVEKNEDIIENVASSLSSSSTIKGLVENFQFNSIENQPMPIIHCSAGIGRTGCLAAILNGLRQMRLSSSSSTKSEHKDEDYSRNVLKQITPLPSLSSSVLKKFENNNFRKIVNVDVLAIVCNLRLQRGGMVQNSEQYELIHRTLCLYLKRLEEGSLPNDQYLPDSNEILISKGGEEDGQQQ